MRSSIAIGLMLLLAATSSQGEPEGPGPSIAAPLGSTASYREVLGLGQIVTRTVEAEGIDGSQEAATLRALDAAIAQVNGRRVSSASMSATAGIRLEINNASSLEINSRAYADLVVACSDGVVQSFTVLSSEEINNIDAEMSLSASGRRGEWIQTEEFSVDAQYRAYSRYWKVRIRAEVAQFQAPESDGLLRILVAIPRHASRAYTIGDERVAADVVGNEIRRRLNHAISQSGRFVLLDRELAPELEREIEFINEGNARLEDVARLGQQLAADLILVPTVARFEYHRETRQLRMSDRQLISYAGGGSMDIQLVNATTGQVILARRFQHDLPTTEASTIPRSIDGTALTAQLIDSLSDQMLGAIIGNTFPISILALKGDLVALSQGGSSVKAGEIYKVVRLGDVLTDPQTGRSLGRMELPCCEVRVERVSDRIAYGTLSGASGTMLADFEPGMLELREKVEPAEAGKTGLAVTGKPAEKLAPEAPLHRPPARKKETDEDPDW